ncbi:MAG: hypothetical protein AMJ59_12745 [Gammaproteobacteria bacterium SG8_31]|nr:MAG: hypothetical protein AMJ59_12745 [Gammaproteobacteria bacterium SG8_31]
MEIDMNTVAIKAALTYPKTKKGDVVVIELTSSYTTAKLKTVKTSSYFLAKVTKTRNGLAVDYTKADGAKGIVDTRHRVMVISQAETQAAARDMFGASLADFDNVDQAKEAILQRVKDLS